MIVSALNALIIGCSVGGAFILIALIIVIVFLVYHFRLCCKQTKGDKYASNITGNKGRDSSLEKKYSSQNGLPPTGLGLWTKNPSLQTSGAVPNGAPNPGQSAISAFYKSDNARGSFVVRNIDKSRQKLNNNDLQTTATPTPFEWPSIDDVHVNQPPSNNNSYGSQARLIVTDVDRGVVGDQPRKSKPTAGPVQPTPGSSGDPRSKGNQINVEAVIEKLPSNRPMNGKMTIPPLEKKLIGEAFQFLDELE